jgi:hypothetical protein
MSPRPACPRSEEEWNDVAAARGIGSIHGLIITDSASKIKVDQFLALKVLWTIETDINRLKDADWAARLGTTPQELSATRVSLRKDSAWGLYLDTIPSSLKPFSPFSDKLGRFAMVLQNQSIVNRLAEGTFEHVKARGSPIVTRGRAQLNIGNIAAPRWAPRDTSVGSEKDGSQSHHSSPDRPDSRPNSTGTSEASKAASDATIISGIDWALSKAVRDAMADEQVVNTAAISFLQSLFVGNDSQHAYWSPQRKGFCFGTTKFKAFVDGHLQVVNEARSAAILEVKARRRPPLTSNDFKIEWQESAQMALWIREEPSSYWTTQADHHKCR